MPKEALMIECLQICLNQLKVPIVSKLSSDDVQNIGKEYTAVRDKLKFFTASNTICII